MQKIANIFMGLFGPVAEVLIFFLLQAFLRIKLGN